MTGQLLTARAVAEQLDVSPATVLRWTRHGDIPAIRLPSGQIRYSVEQLDQWMLERATTERGVRTTTPAAAHVRTLPSTVRTTTDDEE
jgi:excisionase family DNA binding protein